MLRYVEMAIAALIACGGLTALVLHRELHAVVAVPLLVFLRGFVWRLGLRKGLVLLIVPLIPFALRHRGKRNVTQLGAHCQSVGRLLRRRWQRLPTGWRYGVAIAAMPLFLLGCFVALFAGGVLGFLAFLLPFRFTASTFVGEFLQRRALPFLTRIAAAHGLHNLFLPMLSDIVPGRIRVWIHRRYRRLWWATTRRLVRDRKAMGRRAASLLDGRRALRDPPGPSATRRSQNARRTP